MKRLILLLITMLTLCGCAADPSGNPVTVSLLEADGLRAAQTSVTVVSGDDALFAITLDPSYILSGVDYDGEYRIETRSGQTYLRLLDVRYPARVGIITSCSFNNIAYHPNGGTGEETTIQYDNTFHPRPNTSIGTDLYSRDGYTLTGWNTEPDGSGTAVGLGSRVSVPEGMLDLYAQWAKWSDPEDFEYTNSKYGPVICGYHGSDDPVVIPGKIDGLTMFGIAKGAFENSEATAFVFPSSFLIVEDGAFQNCAIQELTFFDNIMEMDSGAFENCPNFQTLHINAIEAPYGYDYRRESCFADKLDLLIEAQGQQKIVFYGGCSMWYNLDGPMAQEAVGQDYQVINVAVNGIINSAVQMQIITEFLEPGDIFFHTPELSSKPQTMLQMEMINHDRKLWSGLEYNYDLVALIDLRDFPNFLDSLQYWLENKETTSNYQEVFTDSKGRFYMDEFGCIPFTRTETAEELADNVYLKSMYLEEANMSRLNEYYQTIRSRDVTVYVSYACLNIDAVAEDQKGNVDMMDKLFHEHISIMEGVTLISSLRDYIYHNEDFYDTNYHLLSAPTMDNTSLWMRDLRIQMEQDGLWTNSENQEEP